MRGVSHRSVTWERLPSLVPRKPKRRSFATLAKGGKQLPKPTPLADTNKMISKPHDTKETRFTNKYRALVLDSTYQPIDVINWQRAICLDLFDKVDVLEYYDMYVKSAHDQHLLPAVLRVRVYVARNRKAHNMTVSRRNVMLRDCFTCQYCGTNSNLTIDHIVPASKGGLWEWNNLVTACTTCNGKKGNKSLKQLKWLLKKEPREPSAYELGLLLGVDLNLSTPPKEWVNYLYELKRQSKSVTDEELTEDLTALAEHESGPVALPLPALEKI